MLRQVMTRARLVLLSVAVMSIPELVVADDATTPVASDMAAATTKFIASLSDAEKAKTLKPFDDAGRVDWHNIPKPQRKGFQFKEMSAEQKALCLELLKTALSDEGYLKATRIMTLESNLREGEKGNASAPFRDPERYFLTIFGEPSEMSPWGWSFEGHHFSLNFVISEGQVIADSPSFWGANPATVRVFVEGGPEVGVRTLAQEEQLAFDLLATLTPEQKTAAVIAEKAPADYRAAGQAMPPRLEKQGLSASKMTTEQKRRIRQMLQTYASHLEVPLMKARLAEFDADGWDNVHFAWAGSTTPGVGHYYRIEAPSVILELVNVQSDPQGNPANHIHSVWRHPAGDFGLTSR